MTPRSFNLADHEQAMQAAEAEWRTLHATMQGVWETDFDAILAEQQALVAAGRRVGASGGFARHNEVFDGKLEQLLADLQEAVWQEAG